MGAFDHDTAVTLQQDGNWAAELREGWRIGLVPNGGYVLSIIGRALSEALPHPDPLVINAFYLAPTELGPAEIRVEPLRSSKNTSHASARLYQGGELKVQVTAAFTTLDSLQGENWSRSERPHFTPRNECSVGGDSKLEFRQNVDLRIAEGGEVFRGEAPDGSGEYCGWGQLADGSDPDVISLLMFADAFPPPAFSILGLVGWVPTVELTVQVRAHPAPGPLQMRLGSRHLTEGVIDEDGEIWDSSGALVAISRQTAKVRVPRG